MYILRFCVITSESSMGVKSAAWISLIKGRDILPSGLTVTSVVNSGFSQTETLRTSSGPIRYNFSDNNCSSFDPRESKGGGVCTPRFIAAVSIRDEGGGVCSRIRASSFSFGGTGRAGKEGVWATSSLSAGGGTGGMAVAGGVEGTTGGGSSDGTDPALEDSSAAMGT